VIFPALAVRRVTAMAAASHAPPSPRHSRKDAAAADFASVEAEDCRCRRRSRHTLPSRRHRGDTP